MPQPVVNLLAAMFPLTGGKSSRNKLGILLFRIESSVTIAKEADSDMADKTGVDEQLVSILECLLDQSMAEDRSQQVVQAIAEHPELEQQIRELAATAMIVDEMAAFQSGDFTEVAIAAVSADDFQPGVPRSSPGLRIGKYELLEEIGRGGMGVVYRAHQTDLNRDVALKMIPNAEFVAVDNLARLRREALAAGHLSHPNVVPVYDVGEQDGYPWFCMKFIDGETLSDRLQRGAMGTQEAVRLILPIVDAIRTAHAEGILHRDLKPSNILIADDGTPFVTDFGLSKRTQFSAQSQSHLSGKRDASITTTGAILGTPAWMSPEQAEGQTAVIGYASDIYSLGAVLYAMLTGRPPFQAATPLETLLMVIEQEPPSVRITNPSIDSDLEMIVTKCLQKPADLRYLTADALAQDLRAWLNNEPVSARSWTLNSVLMRLFRESHHVSVLQNWGVLWMWHSLVLLVLCVSTNVIQLTGIQIRWPYPGLWIVGLGIWAVIFWTLRRRSGPVTAVERQIAHVWGGSMICSSLLFALEWIMHRPVLEFSPVLGAIAGMVFLVKAAMLSGTFYVSAMVLFATSPLMAALQQSDLPNLSISLFGVVSAGTFFFPGLKYYRQTTRGESDKLEWPERPQQGRG
ncbi:MAG: serine/threonine protein kinase [Fuerstiella sp.]|nr:serine/threonine protein kinase [Fuerstiella sp.]